VGGLADVYLADDLRINRKAMPTGCAELAPFLLIAIRKVADEA
jgi:hypothetical protein